MARAVEVNVYGTRIATLSGMIDVTKPKHQVQVQEDTVNGRLWVNVDGKCVLRICQMDHPIVYERDGKPVLDTQV